MEFGLRFTNIRHQLQRLVVALPVALFVLTLLQPAHGRQPPESSAARLPMVSQEDVWKLLPPCEYGSGQPVPDWARVLITSMPYTTASMLELDTIYRTSEELDPGFRARLRWTAANANCCEYTRQYAVSDMKRAGMSDEQVVRFIADNAVSSTEEQLALQFVRDLTRQAWQITDEQFAALASDYGEPGAMAIVLQSAYANFQDRMMLTLGVTVEPDGPLAPLNVRFATVAADQKIAMTRPELPDPSAMPAPKLDIPEDWTTAFSFDQLQSGMVKQKTRPERISIPKWEEMKDRIPQQIYPVKKPIRIKWSLSVLGHQPLLGAAWLRTMKTWGRESEPDTVFNESLFWVVTRNLQCFY